MNESVKLGLQDSWAMHEIALTWIEHNSFRASKEAFEWTIQIIGSQKMPGAKGAKRLKEYFAVCNDLMSTRDESHLAELKEKLMEQTQKLLTNKQFAISLGDMVETYCQLLSGDLVIRQGENDFLDGRL